MVKINRFYAIIMGALACVSTQCGLITQSTEPLAELTIANQQHELADIVTDLEEKKLMLEQAPTWESIDNIANYFILKFRPTIASFNGVKLFAKHDAELLKTISDHINTFIDMVDKVANNPNKTDATMINIINIANALIVRSIEFANRAIDLLEDSHPTLESSFLEKMSVAEGPIGGELTRPTTALRLPSLPAAQPPLPAPADEPDFKKPDDAESDNLIKQSQHLDD